MAIMVNASDFVAHSRLCPGIFVTEQLSNLIGYGTTNRWLPPLGNPVLICRIAGQFNRRAYRRDPEQAEIVRVESLCHCLDYRPAHEIGLVHRR
jgi:hypothetical protein